MESYKIRVLQLPERFNLSKLDALIPVMVLLLHLFDGDYFVLLEVDCLENSPERSVADALGDLILLHILLKIIYRN